MAYMNIYDSSVYHTMGVTSQLDTLVKYFINHREMRVPTYQMEELYKSRILTETPISTIFNNAYKSYKLDNLFTCVNIKDDSSVPEGITTPHITIDTLQMRGNNHSSYNAISSLPEYKDKIILNLTHLMKRDGTVSDVNEMQSLFVRGLLCRSYYNNKNWLTPELIKYIGKSYSMTIGTTIAKTYDLPINDQLMITTILTAYIHQMCYEHKETEWVPTISRCEYLGDRLTIVSALESMSEHLKNDTNLTISKVCNLIATFGPSRLNKFDERTFYIQSQRFGTSSIMALIAVEYPPYWVHQLLTALSGVKSGLYFAMKNNAKLVSEGKIFADMLNRSNTFIPAL